MPDFDIAQCKTPLDFEDKARFRKVGQASAQALNALLQQLPQAAAIDALESANWIVRFPKGLPHTLQALKRGGYSSSIVDAKGRYLDTVSLHPADLAQLQAAALSAFSAASFATGQYFLAQITKELSVIRMDIDQIREFLYGDKRAELMAEFSFVQYASQNYEAIMAGDAQRAATITNLQHARIVAMKDIEFYLSDLALKASQSAKNYEEFVSLSEEALRIRASLDASMQLCATSAILETYYSENWDEGFVTNLQESVLYFLAKCDKQILSYFSTLRQRNKEYKGNLIQKVDTTELEKCFAAVVNTLSDPKDSDLKKTVQEAFQAPAKETELYIRSDGAMYQTA